MGEAGSLVGVGAPQGPVVAKRRLQGGFDAAEQGLGLALGPPRNRDHAYPGLGATGHAAPAGAGLGHGETDEIVEGGAGVGGSLEQALHLAERAQEIAPGRPAGGEGVLQPAVEVGEFRLQDRILPRAQRLPGPGPESGRLLEPFELALEECALVQGPGGEGMQIQIEEGAVGPLQLGAGALEVGEVAGIGRLVGEEPAVSQMGKALLVGLADTAHGVETHLHQALALGAVAEMERGEPDHAERHRLLVPVAHLAGDGRRLAGEGRRLLVPPLLEPHLGEPPEHFVHEVAAGRDLPRAEEGGLEQGGGRLQLAPEQGEFAEELVGEDDLPGVGLGVGRLAGLAVEGGRLVEAAAPECQVAQGEIHADLELARPDLGHHAPGVGEVLLAEFPLPELEIHDPQVEEVGDETLAVAEALAELLGLVQVAHRLAVLALVLVEQPQVVEAGRLPGTVFDTAEGGQRAEERAPRLGGTTGAGVDDSQAQLDLGELLVLVGAR